ncbi:MAG: hypothetical protein GY819_17175 [Planctomycetaceae bacterium]|nr:hypothetical protein [Planctomycetaceae bacterium]MCP4464530.1 hypothetical protein [Planctomycetaceae bacterium]MDG1806975.1 hypothetical protein [Pirellulaceae bacterium]MDG2104779.1 hypothetical protein [Pirellulaceae bacterium]
MDILLITCAILGGLLSDPPRIAATEHVDLVEHNHYFDSGGKKVFDQIVYYNWDPSADRYNVVAWRLLKNENQIPVRHPGNRKYYSSWHDGKTLRIIHASRKMETWTQYDPETYERKFLPKAHRADLLRFDLKR